LDKSSFEVYVKMKLVADSVFSRSKVRDIRTRVSFFLVL